MANSAWTAVLAWYLEFALVRNGSADTYERRHCTLAAVLWGASIAAGLATAASNTTEFSHGAKVPWLQTGLMLCLEVVVPLFVVGYALQRYRCILAQYHLDAKRVPLLVFDPWDWNAPFAPAD